MFLPLYHNILWCRKLDLNHRDENQENLLVRHQNYFLRGEGRVVDKSCQIYQHLYLISSLLPVYIACPTSPVKCFCSSELNQTRKVHRDFAA